MKNQSTYFDFVLPTKLKFGPGKRDEIVREIKSLGFRRVGLVTTEDIKDLGLLDTVVEGLKRTEKSLEIFSDITSNPHVESVRNGYEFFRKFDPDCLIGLGGGSVIDTTKAISLCLSNQNSDIVSLTEENEVVEPSIPYFAVPTTSGTGSEVDYWAVISDPATNRKLSIGAPEMSPLTAVVDPELTLTLPPELTFYTGLDALSHSLEAYFSTGANEITDVLALKSIEKVFESLATAVQQGKNLPARGDMALASTLGGAAMQHAGLGLVHAMSHQVSGFYDTNHGLANALLIPRVIEFNREAISDKRTSLEETIGADLIESLQELLGIYELEKSQVTVQKEDIPKMAKRAAKNVNAETNPRPAGTNEVERLYRKSFTVN